MRQVLGFAAVTLVILLGWAIAGTPGQPASSQSASRTTPTTISRTVVMSAKATDPCARTKLDTIQANEGDTVVWDLWYLCKDHDRKVTISFSSITGSPCVPTAALSQDMTLNDNKAIECTIAPNTAGTPSNPKRYPYELTGAPYPIGSTDPEIEVPPPGRMEGGPSLPWIIVGGLLSLLVGLGVGLGLSRWLRSRSTRTPGMPRPAS